MAIQIAQVDTLSAKVQNAMLGTESNKRGGAAGGVSAAVLPPTRDTGSRRQRTPVWFPSNVATGYTRAFHPALGETSFSRVSV